MIGTLLIGLQYHRYLFKIKKISRLWFGEKKYLK